jgi:hypothetical protein
MKTWYLVVFLAGMPCLMAYSYGDETFCFYDNVWEYNGETVSQALVGDRVLIRCRAENIPDGERVTIYIRERNNDRNDLVAELYAFVHGGTIERPWVVEFDEEKCISCAWEIKDKGFTIPEYLFEVEYRGSQGYKRNGSDMLVIKEWVKTQIVDEGSGMIMANRPYTLILGDGSKITGRTDADGYIIQSGLVIGDIYFYLMEE